MFRDTPYSYALPNAEGVPVSIFANEQVRVEQKAVDELLGFIGIQSQAKALHHAAPGRFPEAMALSRVSISPDFHKGSGIPVGTAALTEGFWMPQAVGKDINCGMRLLATGWQPDQVREKLPELKRRIRHVFFEGGRGIALDGRQKQALLEEGLMGLLAESRRHPGQGHWRHWDHAQEEADLARVIDQGSLPARGISPVLRNYLGDDRLRFDSQIGTIGGGNHFVEVQQVEEVLEGHTAHAWGLKPGMVVVMVHSGCVSIGHPVATFLREALAAAHPAGMAHPANGIYLLPDAGDQAARECLTALHNAANFAFGNRLFLGWMMRRCLEDLLGPAAAHLVYDAGHNMVQPLPDGSFLHRKGATPARGPAEMAGTPFAWTGEPVLIPGSMGSSSYLMAGCGNPAALWTASHGAGRSLSRGEAMRGHDEALRAFLRDFHIVTPIDPESPQVKGRADILAKWEEGIRQEAPWAFKDVGAVVQTQVDAGILRPVARLSPILTVKG